MAHGELHQQPEHTLRPARMGGMLRRKGFQKPVDAAPGHLPQSQLPERGQYVRAEILLIGVESLRRLLAGDTHLRQPELREEQ